VTAEHTDDALLSPQALSKLKWRCRRGLLENDLFIERFLSEHGNTLTERQARGLYTLMDLADNDLLDLLLARKPLDPDPEQPEAAEVLKLLQQPTNRLAHQTRQLAKEAP
jgi:antitoxin CptB